MDVLSIWRTSTEQRGRGDGEGAGTRKVEGRVRERKTSDSYIYGATLVYEQG